jgi:hypothetical protein
MRRGVTKHKKGRAEASDPPILRLEAHYVFRLQTLWALANFEFYGLAFIQAAVTLRLNGRVMHKNILTGLALDEAKTLARIKPLHCSLFFH